MVCGCLKFVRKNFVDIDRDGPRAQVIPFAQKEMVERFLYGLDENIQRQIAKFCRETVPAITKELFEQLEFDDATELVFCLSRMVPGFDGLQLVAGAGFFFKYHSRGFGPHEWLGLGVVVVEIVVDRSLQLSNAAECAAPDALSGDFGEEALHQVEP